MERLHGTVHGDVQGVGFRYFLMREAQRLGLRGWVRNRDDGTVEFVAEGSRDDLDRLGRRPSAVLEWRRWRGWTQSGRRPRAA